MSTVHRLNKELGITVVLVTHFMEEAVGADRIVVMDSGRIVMDGTPAEVFSQADKVRECGLDVPQPTELCRLLDLGNAVLSVDKCVERIAAMLGGKV